MRINLILAQSTNGVIGVKNTLPWSLPEDLIRFKQLTMNYPVIMGRKTWDSIPVKFKPLPNRTNLVLTRQEDWSETGATAVKDLQSALKLCKDCENVWVIGGAQVYEQALPVAHHAFITEIDDFIEGDAFAPKLGPNWKETSYSRHVAKNSIKYSFTVFTNQSPQPY